MTSSGAAPRRGFLSGLSSALTPPIVTDDDPSEPLVTPPGVKVATVLAMVAGLVFLFLGSLTAFTVDRQIDVAIDNYNSQVTKCVTEVGGIGDAAKALDTDPQERKDLASQCGQFTVASPTPDMISGLRNQIVITGIVFAVLGLVCAAAGWYLRQGAAWARRAIVAVLIAVMLGTMFIGISNLFIIVAALMLVVGVLLCYLGKGGAFFTISLIRRRAAKS